MGKILLLHWENLTKTWKISNYYSVCGNHQNVDYIITTCKRSLGQGNIFSSMCQEFCSQGGVCLSACWDTTTPLGPGTSLEQTPPGPGTPLEQTPLHSACWEIWSTSGWYVSYWNAILLVIVYSSILFTHVTSANSSNCLHRYNSQWFPNSPPGHKQVLLLMGVPPFWQSIPVLMEIWSPAEEPVLILIFTGNAKWLVKPINQRTFLNS